MGRASGSLQSRAETVDAGVNLTVDRIWCSSKPRNLLSFCVR